MPIKVKCENCKKDFLKKPSHVEKNNYCSSACFHVVRRKNQKTIRNKRTCETCGTVFMALPSADKYEGGIKRRARFCSRQCFIDQSKHRTSRICSYCKSDKPIAEFHSQKSSCCKPCRTKKQWIITLRKKYGLTLERVNLMLEAQGNKCAICKEKLAKPQIDHCHTTGKVRGILCRPCNQGIGFLKENKQIFYSAIEYIDFYSGV